MPPTDHGRAGAHFWLAQDSPDPQVRLAGVPSAQGSPHPSGVDLTPLALRDRLSRFTTLHAEWGVDFGGVSVRDEGNWPVSGLDRHQMPPMVERLAGEQSPVPLRLFIGGDNAITRPLVGSLGNDMGKVGLVTFDARHDVRSLEEGPANDNPVRGLVEEDGLPGGNVAQIGIHSFANTPADRAFCEEREIAFATMDRVEEEGIGRVVGEVLARLEAGCDVIYVDVDLGVLDRALAPACPGARPGGMTVRQLAAGLRRCGRHPKVAAFDLVEVDAAADPTGQTLDAAAHVLLAAVAGFAER